MNIDKFGHHVHKRLRVSDYLDNSKDSLVKSEEGYFDLKFTRLTGLPSPEHDDDAVKRSYVDQKDKELKNEMTNSLKKYLTQLEKLIAERLTNSYTKQEVDELIKVIREKNNQT